MSRRHQVASGKVGPAWDPEARARAKYLRARLIPGTKLAVSDLAIYPILGSAGLRAAAEKALAVELEASVALAEMLKGSKS